MTCRIIPVTVIVRPSVGLEVPYLILVGAKLWLLLCIFQVTFVFTNQVNGKLVPVESTISPKLQQKELLKLKPRRNVEQKSTPFALHDKLSLRSASTTSCSFPKESLNSVKITKNISINVALRTEQSLVNAVLPQKRSRPADSGVLWTEMWIAYLWKIIGCI